MMGEQIGQSKPSYSSTSIRECGKARLPDFLGIGTQKGGTTTLHYLLNEDERVGLPKVKELHYFDQTDLMPTEWYTEQFKDIANKQIVGEITPYYMHYPLAPIRIKETIPNVKLIALLRDPVDRAISQYFHAKRSGYEKEDMINAIDMEEERLASGSRYSHQKHSYIARSRYNDQLDRYLDIFPKNRILIMKSETLFKKQDEAWAKIQVFLGLEPKTRKGEIPKANKGKGESRMVDTAIREKIRKKLESTYSIMANQYNIRWN